MRFGNPRMTFDRARPDTQKDAVTARLAVYRADLSLAPEMRVEALGGQGLGPAATRWRITQAEHQQDVGADCAT